MNVGDLVLSEDPKTGIEGYKKVLTVYKKTTNELYILNVDGESINTTSGHLFMMSNRMWKSAKNIKVGDKIVDADGSLKQVNSIEVKKPKDYTRIYNLKVEDYHTYFVGIDNLMVHNDCLADAMAAGRDAIETAKANGITDPDVLSRVGTEAAEAESALPKIEAEVEATTGLTDAELNRISTTLRDKSKTNLSSVMEKEIMQGVADKTYDLDIITEDGKTLYDIKMTNSGTEVYIDEATGKTVKVSYIVRDQGVRGSGYSRAVVPNGTERGHLESILEGAEDNCIEDSPINITPQTPEVNDPEVKAFERYRAENCKGMKVTHTVLDNGYVRVQVPNADIDVTYNPLSTIATDPVDGWPSDWFKPKYAGRTWN